MPVIVSSQELHPFLPSLGSGAAIERERASHQDIRPLRIVIMNLMADKVATERQLALWLGHTPLQVELTFAAPDTYVREIRAGRESKNTPSDHIRKFYSAWSDIKENKYDGLIVTGVNALKPRVSDEDVWPEVQNVFRWSETNVFSSLFLCWGAKAALKHFHDVESTRGSRKTSGLFEHQCINDKTGLLFGFPDRFSIPISRWKNPEAAAIAKCPALEIVALAEEVGPNILVESASFDHTRRFPRRVYLLNHPEYDTETLCREFERDRSVDPTTPVPRHYFPNDDPSQKPLNTWRFAGTLYSNWVDAMYDATPYAVEDIPEPFRS